MLFYAALILILGSGVHAGNSPTYMPTTTPTTYVPSISPAEAPTSMPSNRKLPTSSDPTVHTKKRSRAGGLCENGCSGHGTCKKNKNCECFSRNGEKIHTGADCSQYTCPKGNAFVGEVVRNNNLHGLTECSNKGKCDRKNGQCDCYEGYEGFSCSRTTCPGNCGNHGRCIPQEALMEKTNRVYQTVWDAKKEIGCLCDPGYRGAACDRIECPTGDDPKSGLGASNGRDCSGRGLCEYTTGTCGCFEGFYGAKCEQSIDTY